MIDIANIEVSDIGSIAVQLDIDEDAYAEFLDDNSLSDSMESRVRFVRDEDAEYEVEVFDAITYHSMGFDYMTIDEIEDYFGEGMASRILGECMDGESHEYESSDFFGDREVNLSDPEQLSKAAMERLPHGEYFKGARGFILPNGVIVYTPMEHNHCSSIPGVEGTFHFIELGCIRVLEQGIDIAKEPTYKQYSVLSDILAMNYGKEFYVDLRGGKAGRFGKRYTDCDGDEIISDIENYYKGRPIRESAGKPRHLTEGELHSIVKRIVDSICRSAGYVDVNNF